MPEADLDLLIRAAKAAGNVALDHAQQGIKGWDKPDGAGPVTEADLAVNDLLHETLRSARPDYGWLSEETEDNTDRLSTDWVFIIDPIDGTRSFVEGSDTWAHSLAIAHKGNVVAAVVYLPARDKIYTAAQGQGAFFNGQKMQASSHDRLSGARVLAAKPALAPEHWVEGPPDLRRSFRPSLAYRLALVAEGRYDAMLTLRPTWEWDIAAGVLLCEEAGARTSDRFGAPLIFNNPEPRLPGIVAAGTALHGGVASALKS